MIRTRKPVQLLEWGEGTNTTNQIWTPIGEGKITRQKRKQGVTSIVIQLKQKFAKKNTKDQSIKIAQQGEGMTYNSKRWGEVAMGVVKSVEPGEMVVHIDVTAATKFDTRSSVPAWEEADS